MGKLFVPRLIVRDFTDGDRPAFVEVRKDDETVQAEALWWENHGYSERAEEVLEAYC